MFVFSISTKFYGKQSNMNFRIFKRNERYELNNVSLLNAVWAKTYENKIVWLLGVNLNV